ncbi:MAG TPA: glycosyltransferase [Nitrospira sp.]|nr:glycosyltransferase [Nitrospira sp.]
MPIKILYVALDLDLGGLQRIVSLLIEGLDRRRFEPVLCCFDRGGVFYDRLHAEGISGCILSRRPGPFDAALLVNLIRYVRKNEIDVIHSQNACALYSGLASLVTGVPVIHTDHGRLVPDKKSAMWEDWIASFCVNTIVGVSEELTAYLNTQLGIAMKKLKTIINGVDTDRFTPVTWERKIALRVLSGLATDDFVLGTVCRFDPIKNLPFMISCMPEIVKRVPLAKLVIVGEGQIRQSLEEIVQALGMTDYVAIWPRHEDIEQVLPQFDIYVCTSLSEGTSMTILEAMACGLPVVASAVGGNCSLVDSTSGILFPLTDRDAYISSVAELLLDPVRVTLMRKCGRKRVETLYPLRSTIHQYESLYSRCVSSNR